MLFFIKKHFYGENFAFFDNSLYFCKKKIGRNQQKERNLSFAPVAVLQKSY